MHVETKEKLFKQLDQEYLNEVFGHENSKMPRNGAKGKSLRMKKKQQKRGQADCLNCDIYQKI